MGNTLSKKVFSARHGQAGVDEGADIVGFGTAYPGNVTNPEDYEAFVRKRYESTPA